MKYPTFNAEKRNVVGRKVKKLRRDGLLPANIYGKKIKSQAITVSLKDFRELFEKVGETNIVEVILKGDPKSRPCLITNIHIDPVTSHPLHADLHQVDLTQKVTADIPVEIIGESPAVKEKGAVLITLIDEIEVEALPTDLPDKFEIDVSDLKEFDDSILVKDLKVDRSKVSIKLEDTDAVVMVQKHKEEEIEAPPAPAAEGEAAAAEGEAAPPAEGEAPAAEAAKEGEKPTPGKTEEKSGAKAGEAPKPEAKKE